MRPFGFDWGRHINVNHVTIRKRHILETRWMAEWISLSESFFATLVDKYLLNGWFLRAPFRQRYKKQNPTQLKFNNEKNIIYKILQFFPRRCLEIDFLIRNGMMVKWLRLLNEFLHSTRIETEKSGVFLPCTTSIRTEHSPNHIPFYVTVCFACWLFICYSRVIDSTQIIIKKINKRSTVDDNNIDR